MTPNAAMKTRRAELGFTQGDVARLAGCSKQWVSRIEQGLGMFTAASAAAPARIERARRSAGGPHVPRRRRGM